MNFFSQFSVVLFRVVDMVINLRFILCIFIYLFIFTREKKTSKYFGIYIGQYQLIAFFFLCVSKQKKKIQKNSLWLLFFLLYFHLFFLLLFSRVFYCEKKWNYISYLCIFCCWKKIFFFSPSVTSQWYPNVSYDLYNFFNFLAAEWERKKFNFVHKN